MWASGRLVAREETYQIPRGPPFSCQSSSSAANYGERLERGLVCRWRPPRDAGFCKLEAGSVSSRALCGIPVGNPRRPTANDHANRTWTPPAQRQFSVSAEMLRRYLRTATLGVGGLHPTWQRACVLALVLSLVYGDLAKKIL